MSSQCAAVRLVFVCWRPALIRPAWLTVWFVFNSACKRCWGKPTCCLRLQLREKRRSYFLKAELKFDAGSVRDLFTLTLRLTATRNCCVLDKFDSLKHGHCWSLAAACWQIPVWWTYSIADWLKQISGPDAESYSHPPRNLVCCFMFLNFFQKFCENSEWRQYKWQTTQHKLRW